MEDGIVSLGRARISLTYPSRFMLLAAMNPCPCGYYGTGQARCVCTPMQVQRYVGRISGPLLDRIDLHVEVPSIAGERLTEQRRGEASAVIRERVLAARLRQEQRFADATCPGKSGTLPAVSGYVAPDCRRRERAAAHRQCGHGAGGTAGALRH
jgi:magnesium chelatase family protein